MKKFKKIIVIIPIIVILFSLICIPVSAVGSVHSVPISQPPVGDNYGYVEVLGGYGEAYVYLYTIISSNNSPCFLSVTGYLHEITFGVNISEPNTSYMLYLYVYRNDGTSRYIGSTLDGTLSDRYVQGIAGVHVYGNSTFIQSGAWASSIDWSVIYGSDTYSYNALLDILAVLRSQSNADIIANADKNANNIQSNADKNANEIKENADKNTSQITDGYENDTDTTLEGSDDYKDLEEEAIGSTNEQAKAEASNVTDGANSGFLKYMSAFTSVGNMFADFFQITVPDFGILVMISLAIGILPLLVGLTVNDAKSRDRFNAREARSARKIEMHNAKVRSRKGG